MPQTLHFNGIPPQQDLKDLNQLIGLRLSSIRFEQASMNLSRPNRVDCMGSCRFSFMNQNRDLFHWDIESVFEETSLPVSEQGELHTRVHTEPYQRLAERLKNPPPKTNHRFSIFSYTQSPLKSISLYGNSQNSPLNELDPDFTLEHLKSYHGLDEFPIMQIESVEMLILEHEDGIKTHIRLDNNGFAIEFLQRLPDSALKEQYSMVNCYVKNIRLQYKAE